MSDFSRFLSGFSQSFSCTSTGVFLHLIPPRFTFLVGDWSSSMALLLPGRLPPPLPLAITGAFSLSLGLPPLPAVLQFSVLSAPSVVVSFQLVSMTCCSLGSLALSSLGYLGALLPELPAVSLQFCFLPGVHVFFVHGFRLPHRFSLQFLSFAPPWLCLAISFLQFFFLWSPSGRFGVCLPWLLSLPFQYVILSFSVYGRLVGLPGFPSSLSASLVYLPLSFLQLVTSFPSLGALLTQSNLRYSTRRGLPLG